VHPITPDVTSVIERWHSAVVPAEAVEFARQVVSAAGPTSAARARALLFASSRLGAFAHERGIELSAGAVLCASVIERFVVEGRRDISAPTRRTLRTNLRALARAVQPHPVPAPVPLPREHSKTPYTQMEISAYLALAAAQPSAARANRASALICLGAGAGLVGADLRAVRGADVASRSGGVVVAVAGRRPRVVPVLARFHGPLLACATFAGDDLLISGGSPARRNVAGPLVASLAGGGGLARLEVWRLRATWLAEVARFSGLRAFMDAAGVECSQRLGDIVAGLPALDEAESVRLLGGRSC
jgi:integrase